jgi:hypothetical protein
MTKQARKAHYTAVVNALCNGRLVPFLGAGGAATSERPYRARFLRQRAQLVAAGRLAATSFLDDFDLAGYVHDYGRAFATARQEAQA